MQKMLRAESPDKLAALLAALYEPVAAMQKQSAGGGKSVAVIQVSGVMMKQSSWMGGTSTIQVRRELRDAAADPDVGAVLLSIDSPGGSVAGMAELAADARAAAAKKPVWAQIADVGASAAYWLATQADRIVANSPLTMVGSIGVYQPLYDFSGSAEKEGVKVHLATTGPLKGMGVPGTPITEAQVAHVQRLVDYVHARFTGAVAKARGLSAKEVAAVAHGGTLPAPEALDARLIDVIQPVEKTLAELARVKPGGARAEADQGAGRSGGAGGLPALQRRGLPTLGG